MVRIENLREEPVDIDKEVALLRREIRQAREALLNVPLEEARKRTNIGTLRQRFVWAAAVVLHTNEEEDGKKVAFLLEEIRKTYSLQWNMVFALVALEMILAPTF